MKANIVDVNYQDISNTRLKRGVFSTEIYLKARHHSDEVRLPAVGKEIAPQLHSLIQKGIRGELFGMNTGPTAVETLLAALGSCIAGTYAAQATARGIKIDDLEVEVDGSIDLQGFFQLAPIRAGPSGIKVNVRVKSDDAEESKLLEIGQMMHKASPVTDSISNPVKIEISMEKV